MKKFYLTITMVVFLLICLNGIQAQTTQAKLNQVDLMKQFIGNWRLEVGKDTIVFYDQKAYGTGLDVYYKYYTKGKIVWEGRQLYGYDKNNDKIIVASMDKGKDIELYAGWFISNNKYVFIPYSHISNPEKASKKWEGEFKSADIYIEITIANGKPVGTDTYTRVK